MAGKDGRQPFSLREEIPGLAEVYQQAAKRLRAVRGKRMDESDVRITGAEADREYYTRQESRQESRLDPESLPKGSPLRRNVEAMQRLSNVPTEQRAYLADPWFWRVVIGLLGVITVFGLVGIFSLAFYQIEVPGSLIAITSGASGALAGLFR